MIEDTILRVLSLPIFPLHSVGTADPAARAPEPGRVGPSHKL
jgi:hypothetical protein